jgi:hypothetical protein
VGDPLASASKVELEADGVTGVVALASGDELKTGKAMAPLVLASAGEQEAGSMHYLEE